MNHKSIPKLKSRLTRLLLLLQLLEKTLTINKLIFLDPDTNVEVGIWRDDVIINFKHNTAGFIVLAFADARRE